MASCLVAAAMKWLSRTSGSSSLPSAFRPFAPFPVITALSSRLWRQRVMGMVFVTVNSLNEAFELF
jgi:hypothetical protein